MLYLLDTNTCIAAMRKHVAVISRMASLSPGDCANSTITSYELNVGIEKCANAANELTKVSLLLKQVHELGFDASAARESSRIRVRLEAQGMMIGPYDVLLAGHALSLGLTLVTANTGEFSRVPALRLQNWLNPPQQ